MITVNNLTLIAPFVSSRYEEYIDSYLMVKLKLEKITDPKLIAVAFLEFSSFLSQSFFHFLTEDICNFFIYKVYSQ